MEKMIKKPLKNYDAIKEMRKIREEISRKIMEMPYEEEREYLQKTLTELKKTKFKAINSGE